MVCLSANSRHTFSSIIIAFKRDAQYWIFADVNIYKIVLADTDINTIFKEDFYRKNINGSWH